MEIHWYDVSEIDNKHRQSGERRIRALARKHTDVIDVRIAGDDAGHARTAERKIRIACQVRGAELVAKGRGRSASQALDQAIDHLVQEVRKMRRKRRSRQLARPPEPETLGIVESLNREEGYGFILTDGGTQVYFHQNALKHGLPFEGLEEAARVALSVVDGNEGPQASAVFPAPASAPVP